MPPKKGKGKGKGKGKKPKSEPDKNILTEVDKTFYELQITDLNRKLARLRSLTQELEDKNSELLETNSKLDEDRADIIAYLKRTLQERTEEISELQDRLKSLHEKKTQDEEDFKMKVHEMEEEYKQMQEHLTSEIKLLNGKLNALEEFRLQRDELMKKYEDQENALEEQEIQHKREIYSIERKFIIGKDKLKKEMEARLLQLSTDFQDVTDVRVAATTHRVIRENIAINNELNVMLDTQKLLQTENDKLRARDKTLRLQAELHESEKKKAMYKVKTQVSVIDSLATEHGTMMKQLEKFKDIENLNAVYEKDLKDARTTIECIEYKMRLLEQNLHSSRCERAKLEQEFDLSQDQVKWLTNTLLEAIFHIKKAMKTELEEEELEKEEMYGEESTYLLCTRENLIPQLYKLLTEAQGHKPLRDSMDSIKSCSEIYMRGDLGFIPKKVELRSKLPIKRNVDTQVGASLENFIAMQESAIEIRDEIEESEEDEMEDEAIPHEEESQIFFDGELSEDQDDIVKGDSFVFPDEILSEGHAEGVEGNEGEEEEEVEEEEEEDKNTVNEAEEADDSDIIL